MIVAEMGIWSAVMKAVWGTDAACTRRDQRADANSLLAEAEASVERLHQTLDRAAENLDETLKQIAEGR